MLLLSYVGFLFSNISCEQTESKIIMEPPKSYSDTLRLGFNQHTAFNAGYAIYSTVGVICGLLSISYVIYLFTGCDGDFYCPAKAPVNYFGKDL